MHTENINRLIAEMAKSRKLNEEAMKQIRNSIYSFRSRLDGVKWNLHTTAQRFSELSQEHRKAPEAIIVEMHRRLLSD